MPRIRDANASLRDDMRVACCGEDGTAEQLILGSLWEMEVPFMDRIRANDLRAELLVAEVEGTPWPEDAYAPGHPLKEVRANGTLIGARSVGQGRRCDGYTWDLYGSVKDIPESALVLVDAPQPVFPLKPSGAGRSR